MAAGEKVKSDSKISQIWATETQNSILMNRNVLQQNKLRLCVSYLSNFLLEKGILGTLMADDGGNLCNYLMGC